MYKLEIFNYTTQSFVRARAIPDTTPLEYDYLSPSVWTITTPQELPGIDIFNTVRVTNNNKILYEGYIYAFKHTENGTELSIRPLIKLLDVVSVQNQPSSGDWAWQIRMQIWYDFQQVLSETTAPSLYPLPWVYAEEKGNNNSWGGARYTYGPILATDLSCVQLARTVAGRYMGFGIDPETFAPAFWFMRTPDRITIEADLPNIIKKEINESSGTGTGANIAKLWYPSDETGTNYNSYSAYILPDGTISYNWRDKGRVTNPRVKARQLTAQPTDRTARQNMLLELLKPQAANNTIKLTVSEADKIIDPENMQIGTPAIILNGGKSYQTTLTGWHREGDLITLIFGAVRNDLTKKLIDLLQEG